jgi:hypothetical protein
MRMFERNVTVSQPLKAKLVLVFKHSCQSHCMSCVFFFFFLRPKLGQGNVSSEVHPAGSSHDSHP